MNDDLNTPIVLSHLFEAVRIINSAIAGHLTLSEDEVAELRSLFDLFLFDLLGVRNESQSNESNSELLGQTIELLLELRKTAKTNKDWSTSDMIRNRLIEMGVEIKDTKEGVEWKIIG